MRPFFDLLPLDDTLATPVTTTRIPARGISAKLTTADNTYTSAAALRGDELSQTLVTDIARNLIKTHCAKALDGGLEPVFGKPNLEHFESNERFERYEAVLKRHGLGLSRFRVTLRFYRGELLVSRAVLDGALVFAELESTT